jgi:hypothetical protein
LDFYHGLLALLKEFTNKPFVVEFLDHTYIDEVFGAGGGNIAVLFAELGEGFFDS